MWRWAFALTLCCACFGVAHVASSPDVRTSTFSKSLHNASFKGFALCNTSKDCSYGGACISNHLGFVVKDHFEFQYRRSNGNIKTKHWLVVDSVLRGSPADVEGKMKPGYYIDAIQGILDDNAPTAAKRLVKEGPHVTIKVYRKNEEEERKEAQKKKNVILYGHVYNLTLNVSGGQLGLELTDRTSNGVSILQIIPGGAADKDGHLHKHDILRAVEIHNKSGYFVHPTTNETTLKEALLLLKKAMKSAKAIDGWLLNLTFQRPMLHEYPQEIVYKALKPKDEIHYTVTLKKDPSIKFGQCVCRGYMTGPRCTSLHTGKIGTVIDPIKPAGDPSWKYARVLKNDAYTFKLLGLATGLLSSAALAKRWDTSLLPGFRGFNFYTKLSFVALYYFWTQFLDMNVFLQTLNPARITLPSPDTWGSTVLEVCDTMSAIADLEMENGVCSYHLVTQEHAPDCWGSFFDCAQVIHAVSHISPTGPFERMNYTLLPPGHPSSGFARVRNDVFAVLASKYNDGSNTNASECAALEDTSECLAHGCAVCRQTSRCVSRTSLDAAGAGLQKHHLTRTLSGPPITEALAKHVHRPGQSTEFVLRVTNNISGINGTVNWTASNIVPFQGQPGQWDELIGDPFLTVLNDGSLLLLYTGWKPGRKNESKIGIAVSSSLKQPFIRRGDGLLLGSSHGNQSFSEPYLHIDASGHSHVFFAARPAETCPSELRQAVGASLASLELIEDMPLIGCESVVEMQKSLSDALGKSRNGMDERPLHSDEVLEFGSPRIYHVGSTPLYVTLGVARHNTPMPLLMQSTVFERVFHWLAHLVGLAPFEYESDPWPPKSRSVQRELITSVQGVVVDAGEF